MLPEIRSANFGAPVFVLPAKEYELVKFLCVLTLATLNLVAADATGRWTGTLIPLNSAGDTEGKPAYLVLKQEGTKLTGTAGPHEGEQYAISEGKAEDGRLTFQVQEKSMRFDLKQEGDEIAGEITREHEGEMQKAKLTVKRQH